MELHTVKRNGTNFIHVLSLILSHFPVYIVLLRFMLFHARFVTFFSENTYLDFSLGFLSTGDGHASGNYALLDIVAALHWMRENIEAFGGNPRQATLLGHGYGAAIVNLLLISPVTRGQ